MSRRTQEEWRDLVAQQQSSGVSAAQFCRERSINPKYFSTRKKQLCGSANSFVWLTPSTTPSMPVSSVTLRIIEVDVPNGVLLDSLSLLVGSRDQ